MTLLQKEVTIPAGILLSVEGIEKTGKTFLPLATGPEPVAYINCDRDNRRLLRALQKDGRNISSHQAIYVPRADENILREKDRNALAKQAARALPYLKSIKTAYLEALEGDYRTVVLDSGKRLYDVMRIARFGKLMEIPPVLYSKTNFEYASLLHAGANSDKVVIIINRIGDEWKNGRNENGQEVSSKTGNLVVQGFKETNFEVAAVIRTGKDPEFTATITDEGVGRRGIRGMTFEGDTLNMPSILGKLTSTKESRWM